MKSKDFNLPSIPSLCKGYHDLETARLKIVDHIKNVLKQAGVTSGLEVADPKRNAVYSIDTKGGSHGIVLGIRPYKSSPSSINRGDKGRRTFSVEIDDYPRIDAKEHLAHYTSMTDKCPDEVKLCEMAYQGWATQRYYSAVYIIRRIKMLKGFK